MHVKFSDDDGRTWNPWGKGASLPGSQAAGWSDGTYGYPETVITPYKEHIACFWRHKRKCGVKWSVYDGSDWSPPAEVSPETLDDMDGAYRATMSAITKGDREIFFTATGLKTVLRWDGKSWHAEPVRIEDGGMLSLAGFSVPPYAPSNFIPLVWSDHDEGTIKLLKVPVPLTLPKDRKTDK